MGNQKYIISFLLIIIVVLLGFTTYLLFQRPVSQPQTTTQNTTAEKSTTIPTEKKETFIYNDPSKYKEVVSNIKIPEITERAPTEPEIYLGENITIPDKIGCVDIGQYRDGKKPSQDDVKNSITKELHSVIDGRILNGWMFQQACRADDYTIAYSLYNKDRSDKNLSNNMVISFVEDKISLSYYVDERINKPSTGSEICNIYKLTTTYLEYSCNTDNGEKKWQLPFSQKKRVTPLN